MKNKIIEMFSKLNKGVMYILGVIFVFFGILYLFNLLEVSQHNSIYFVVYGFIIILISLFLVPFIIVWNSPKFTKKEKKKFMLYDICIYLFVLIILGFYAANYFAILYWFYMFYLFWTHRKNDYSKESAKIETPQEEIKE